MPARKCEKQGELEMSRGLIRILRSNVTINGYSEVRSTNRQVPQPPSPAIFHYSASANDTENKPRLPSIPHGFVPRTPRSVHLACMTFTYNCESSRRGTFRKRDRCTQRSSNNLRTARHSSARDNEPTGDTRWTSQFSHGSMENSARNTSAEAW